MRTNTRRPGITLLEVLAAIFIMGVGMLAILTLFPLGALNMARALRDDRLGHIAYAADSLATARDLHLDQQVQRHMLLAPDQVPIPNVPAGTYAAPDPAGPSYAVFVDPYYLRNGGAPFQVFSNMVAPAPPSPLGRYSPPWAQTQTGLERHFSLQDDLTFEPDGRLKGAGGQLERQGYYTWSYMLRRQVSGDPSTTELYVIVYSGRPVNVPQQEPTYTVVKAPAAVPPPTAKTTTLVLDPESVTGEAAALRRGNWLFDISYSQRVVAGQTYGYVNAHFYRVIEATKLANNQVQVEIEPPLKADLTAAPAPRMVSLEYAVEVFNRGSGR